ncbi:MAG: type II secretion system protein [Pseudomonadota bacterium]
MHVYRHPASQPKSGGFTTIEIILVILIMGVLGAIAGTRYFARSDFDHSSYTAQVVSVIRYGQKVAIAQNRAVFVRLDGTGVALCFDSGCTAGNRVQAGSGSHSGKSGVMGGVADPCLSDAAWACERLPTGITISASGTFWFDALGVPYELADSATAASSFVRRDLSISNGNPATIQHIFVEAQTGYAY